MHAYLLITDNEELAREKVDEIIPDARRVIPFLIAKVGDSRELIRMTSTSIPEKTVYLLADFDKASIEAQNAFLKRLEEAQKNLYFALTAKSEEAVLPTIVSRCQVIRARPSYVKSEDATISSGGQENKIDFETIAKITKREEALEYLAGVIEKEREKLAENKESLKIVKAANEAYARIQKNANPTIQLSWFMTQI